MWRYLAGVGSALLLITAGILIWRNQAPAQSAVVTAPPSAEPVNMADSTLSPDDFPDLPAADEKTKEQKRFDRYDHNHNGKVDLEEFLASQRKNFNKMDINHDGVLSFEEYAAKRVAKFRVADANHDGILTAAEFATTRAKRKSPSRRSPCAKVERAAPTTESEDQ